MMMNKQTVGGPRKINLTSKPGMLANTSSIRLFPSVSNLIVVVAGILVFLVTFLVYLPALQNGFVNWDDGEYVYENQNLQSIDFGFFGWCLTAVVNALWHPITLFSLAVDYTVWGLNPIGYHLTNSLIHASNTLLVYIIVFKLIKASPGKTSRTSKINIKAFVASLVTALLFGTHPLHVESVAWISERKDVLCAFFFLSTLFVYLKYVSAGMEIKRIGYYILSFLLSALALMSKPMAVTLPVILLIMDYYPLNRLKQGSVRWVLIEKLPFCLLSLGASFITIFVQYDEALKSIESYPIEMRLFNMLQAYIFYLIKLVLPLNLAPFYPYPMRISPLGLVVYFLLLTAITFLCIRVQRQRLFLVLWLYYIIMFVPVIGIIQTGEQAMADRYTYLPSLGPFLLAGVTFSRLFEESSKKQYRVKLIIALLLILLGLLGIKTVKQIAIWSDSVTLWSYEIKIFPNVPQGYKYRGNAYLESGDYQQAIVNYDASIKAGPYYSDAYYNRGIAYSKVRNYAMGIENYDAAIKLYPQYTEAFVNRGLAYYEMGNYRQALDDYSTAIKFNPRDADAYQNLGLVYLRSGDIKQALINYNKAARLGAKEAQEFLRKYEQLTGKKDLIRE